MTILLAYGVVILISLAGREILLRMEVAADIASTIPASVAFLNVGPISRAIRRRTLRGISIRDALPQGAVSRTSPEGLLQALAIAAALVVGAINAASFFGVVAVGLLVGGSQEMLFGAGIGSSAAIGIVASYVLGRWIARRTPREETATAVLSILGALFLARVVALIVDLAIFAMSGISVGPLEVLREPAWWIFGGLWFAAGLVGFGSLRWAGRSQAPPLARAALPGASPADPETAPGAPSGG